MSSKSKGKRKMANPDLSSPTSTSSPTERTSLLSTSTPSTNPHHHPRSRYYISLALITVFSFLFTLLLLTILLLSSFRPSEFESSTSSTSPHSLASTFVYSPIPDHIAVLNVSDAGVALNITVRAGVDVDAALAIGRLDSEDRKAAADQGRRGSGAEWWERLRLWAARTILNFMPSRMVRLDIEKPVIVSAKHSSSLPLIQISLLESFYVPLIQNVPPSPNRSFLLSSKSRPTSPAWLEPVNVLVIIKPIAEAGDVWAFAQHAWEVGSANVGVDVNKVVAGVPGWSWASAQKENLSLDMKIAIPALPNLPRPGQPLNLSSLLKLDSYSFSTTYSSTPSTNSTSIENSTHSSSLNAALHLIAHATLPNFIPSLAGASLPFRLPFSISLPSKEMNQTSIGRSSKLVPIAHVVTEPVVIGAGKNISLGVNGTIDAAVGKSSDALSFFLQRYLSGDSNPIIIKGDKFTPSTPTTPPLFDAATPPDWLLSSLASLEVRLEFPAPYPRPKVVKSVTIENMRLSMAEGRNKMQISGDVVAIVELPKEMESVKLNITAVRPDVLIFDGPIPTEDLSNKKNKFWRTLDSFGFPFGRHSHRANDDDDAVYPPRAFGRINPPEPIPAITYPSPDPENSPNALLVRAPINEVDLVVLSGRDSVLGDFVGKVVFKGGATAGIAGDAEVEVEIKGVESGLDIKGLPVSGEFWVGRNGRGKNGWSRVVMALGLNQVEEL